MALLGQAKLGCVTLLVTVLLGLSSTEDGLKQELWLYKEDGNYLYFHTHVPDLTEYSLTLSNITRHCRTGIWSFFAAVNYQTYHSRLGSGLKEKFCSTLNVATVKSLRHWAANDAATEAISLYSGDYCEGEEIFVDTRAKTDISIHIESFAATGTSLWMLYQGKNFDGKSVCYQVPYPGYEFNWGYIQDFNMTTIGSVFKGCDFYEIQLYRESLLL